MTDFLIQINLFSLKINLNILYIKILYYSLELRVKHTRSLKRNNYKKFLFDPRNVLWWGISSGDIELLNSLLQSLSRLRFVNAKHFYK